MFTIILLLVTGPCLNQVSAKDTVRNTVSAILDKAKEDGEKITLPENEYAEEGLSAAEKTSETFNSPDFQERLQCEQQRLETEVFGDFITSWKKKDAVEEQSGQTGNLGETERVYLFFSSSVPDETVRAYLSSIADAGDPNLIPVMRGFVEGLADMAVNKEYFNRILKKDPDCQDIPFYRCQRYQLGIKLKPSLFAQYGITRVPAVVFENEGNGFLIQGDAGLDYLLERINREANSPSLAKLIRKMRDGNERAE
jgi:hypothetical protein